MGKRWVKGRRKGKRKEREKGTGWGTCYNVSGGVDDRCVLW